MVQTSCSFSNLNSKNSNSWNETCNIISELTIHAYPSLEHLERTLTITEDFDQDNYLLPEEIQEIKRLDAMMDKRNYSEFDDWEVVKHLF